MDFLGGTDALFLGVEGMLMFTGDVAVGVVVEGEILVGVVAFDQLAQGIVAVFALLCGLGCVLQVLATFAVESPQGVAVEVGLYLIRVLVLDQVSGGIVGVMLGSAVKAGFLDQAFVGVVGEGMTVAVFVD